MKLNRRDLLGKIALGSMSLPLMSLQGAVQESSISDHLVILFQGDSITDAGRDRSQYYANRSAGMGTGYVRHVATELLGLNANNPLKIYNRGISGNKVHQLDARWEEDCIQLKPDIVSILIGVNDFWHTLSYGYQADVHVFESDYRALLDRTRKSLPDVRLIIGEPFVMYEGSAIDKDKWSSLFPAYQAVSRAIAEEFDAMFIGYQEVFNKALTIQSTEYWCPDGVHPSMAGSYLMANAWLEAFYSLME